MSLQTRFDHFPSLETPRLMLRQLVPSDIPAALAFLGDAETIRYYDPAPLTREQVAQSIQRHQRRFEQGEALRWGIVLKNTEDLIGNAGFTWDTQHHYASLSYILAKQYWGQGYMPEALAAILHFGFTHCHVHRIEAYVYLPNLASARVLEKLGFTREARIRERQFVEGAYVDETVYALLHHDWLTSLNGEERGDTHKRE